MGYDNGLILELLSNLYSLTKENMKLLMKPITGYLKRCTMSLVGFTHQ